MATTSKQIPGLESTGGPGDSDDRPSRAAAVLRLLWLYVVYWFVGMHEETFQIAKGHHLCDLDLQAAAAKAFERALRGTDSPHVHAMLGYSYPGSGATDSAVTSLRYAYARKPTPRIAVSLLQALVENGDAEECRRLLEQLRKPDAGFPAELKQYLDRAEVELDEGSRLGRLDRLDPRAGS